MKFYSIQNSLDKKVLGYDPQVTDIKYHCNLQDSKFIGNFHYEKLNFNPIVANPILNSRANLTDLIQIKHPGFSFVKLISSRLKEILQKEITDGVQFFQCSVFKDGIEYSNYWIMNFFQFKNDFIDWGNSLITVGIKKDGGGTNNDIINVNTLESFNDKLDYHSKKLEVIKIHKIVLHDNITTNFFTLKNSVKNVVSDKLKKDIEYAGCTGIEFQPTELSIYEWLQGGEREKIYGKI